MDNVYHRSWPSGGLAIFIFGMNMMSDNLQRLPAKDENILAL
ncbi:MAG: hypothetical protein ACLTQI_02050 [Slackia sp.]